MRAQCLSCNNLGLDERGIPFCRAGNSTSRKKACFDVISGGDTGLIFRGKRFCRKCGIIYPVMEFYRNKSYPDGIDCYCMYCRKSVNMKMQSKKNGYQINVQQ